MSTAETAHAVCDICTGSDVVPALLLKALLERQCTVHRLSYSHHLLRSRSCSARSFESLARCQQKAGRECIVWIPAPSIISDYNRHGLLGVQALGELLMTCVK